MVTPVPGDVDEADDDAAGTTGRHPAQAVRPDLIPPSRLRAAAVSQDEPDHLRVSESTTPAILKIVHPTHSLAASVGASLASEPGLVRRGTQVAGQVVDHRDFNTVSPNNGGAPGKVAVRQALSYAINRAHLIQDDGGPQVSPSLTHVLPNGINGAQYVPANYNPFPYNPAKAKSMLKAAGYPNGLNLTVLYNAESTYEPKMYQSLQADMAPAAIHVKALAVPSADLYVKYLTVPSTATNETWDIAMSGWGPDWYGDAADSFFGPIYSGAPSFPPVGSNFSQYNNPTVNALRSQRRVRADHPELRPAQRLAAHARLVSR